MYRASCLASALLVACCQARERVAYGAGPVSGGVGLLRNLHLVGEPSDVLMKGFQLYGIDVVMTSPIRSTTGPLRIDVNDADLTTAGALLGAMTHCFFVPMNAHVVLAVPDSKENRVRFERLITETMVVPNLMATGSASGAADKSVVEGLLATVFAVPKSRLDGDRLSLRAAPAVVDEVKATLETLYHPRPQVELEVKAYVLSNTRNRNLGVALPQSVVVFNVYTAAESLITSNSSIVEELIEEGLATAGDTLGIAELLIAGGYASGTVLGSPSLYFGGGETAMGVQPGSMTENASLTDSTVRELDAMTLLLGDGETGKFTVGEKYPVLTATSEAVSTSSTSVSTPSISYEDLGLTLEAKAHLIGGLEGRPGMSGREVMVHLHETIRSLAGTSLNDIPLLSNQEVTTDLSIPDGVTTVVVSALSRTDAAELIGVTDATRDVGDSRLVITITPRVKGARD